MLATFLVVTPADAPGIAWVESWDAAPHPNSARDVPLQRVTRPRCPSEEGGPWTRISGGCAVSSTVLTLSGCFSGTGKLGGAVSSAQPGPKPLDPGTYCPRVDGHGTAPELPAPPDLGRFSTRRCPPALLVWGCRSTSQPLWPLSPREVWATKELNFFFI